MKWKCICEIQGGITLAVVWFASTCYWYLYVNKSRRCSGEQQILSKPAWEKYRSHNYSMVPIIALSECFRIFRRFILATSLWGEELQLYLFHWLELKSTGSFQRSERKKDWCGAGNWELPSVRPLCQALCDCIPWNFTCFLTHTVALSVYFLKCCCFSFTSQC